jgi:hypothetical protein
VKLTEEQIAQLASDIESAVNSVTIEHYPAVTQEHQLTSRIAQALEDSLNGKQYGVASVSVITQELPDRGRSSLEKPLGGDMYVGISLEGDFDKGLLIQAKWDENQRGLFEQ